MGDSKRRSGDSLWFLDNGRTISRRALWGVRVFMMFALFGGLGGGASSEEAAVNIYNPVYSAGFVVALLLFYAGMLYLLSNEESEISKTDAVDEQPAD